MSETDIPKQFNHKASEERIFALWEKHNVFRGEVDRTKKPFCVVIPPPNVTGILHMGHVLDNVPQDVMTRWHRMRGFSAVWIPGTDHAGIATQSVVAKQLATQGIDIRSLGRDEFVKRVWAWKEKHGGIIISQLKRLGCSCDWSRERFTMDEGLSKAVLTAFIHYFNKGLIYRGKRMINWCTHCGTALSNDEVEHELQKGSLWHIRYPMHGGNGSGQHGYIVVATTRPETMLGDVAVMVNPDDERYKKLIGKKVILPLQNREIPVIADSFVDPNFGSGIVKVTPAHDPNDYQVGLKHNLPIQVVIGLDGKMSNDAGDRYAGLNRFEARKRVISDLEALDLVEKVERYTNSVGQCYRCKNIVEPFVSEQWFVRMKPLAEKAKQAVLDGKLQIIPDSEKHDYMHWMDSIQDWCISRQLWWGHRIPIYYCDGCAHIVASIGAPSKCEKCGGGSFTQDQDVLDTWFSSQLWPFSTLGWPEKTEELSYWYPNSWLMSGRDILFFWDARMVMSGLELMGDVPFRVLALHGLVRDEQGRKLSKSLGNSPDPLELFDKYGTDAVRASIAQRYPMGRQDTRLGERVYEEGEALITKLWNASRLILMNIDSSIGSVDLGKINPERLEDRWILSRLSSAISSHDQCLASSDLVHAFRSIYNFFWNEYCDWYLEIIKPRLWGDSQEKRGALQIALICQRTVLKLLHPYIPFVTEDLWQILKEKGVKVDSDCLAISNWPESSMFSSDDFAEKEMKVMISLVRAVRDAKHHLNISPKLELQMKIGLSDLLWEPIVRQLSLVGKFELYSGKEVPKGFVPAKFDGGVAYISIPPDVDLNDIRGRLEAKIEKLEKGLVEIESRLGNTAFISNAPKELVEENRRKAGEYKEGVSQLNAFLASLG